MFEPQLDLPRLAIDNRHQHYLWCSEFCVGTAALVSPR